MTSEFRAKQSRDLTYGLQKEVKIKPLFEKHFGIKFAKLDKYNTFDFSSVDKKILIELKSRRVDKNQYPSTMVGYNKIKKAVQNLAQGREVYFTFAFKDYICYYKFEEVNKSWIRDGGRCDRGKQEIKPYYYIPTEELKEFDIY